MEDSTTYQAILRKGEEKGHAGGVRSVLLREGTRQFGQPSSEMRSRIEAISDIQKLEAFVDRVFDESMTTWEELLGL